MSAIAAYLGQLPVATDCVISDIPDRQQSQTLILSTNVDEKSSEIEFRLPFVTMAIKNTFLTIFLYTFVVDPRSSIFKSIFYCRLSGVYYGLSVPVTYLFSRTDLFFSLWKLNHSIQTQRISFVFLQFTLHVF